MSHIGRDLNFNEIWMRVSEGLERIYRIQEISPSSHGELYALIYNYCTNTQPQSSGSKIPRRAAQNNRENNLHNEDNVVGEELYTKLKNYLETYLKEIFEVRLFAQESN
ncbi:unnamed protein product [Rotaria sp. Silwood1]|nr:unnamed protein product [Rotaria sp. Silwood1]